MRVHEAIADEIKLHGTSTAFGLIGNDTMRLAAGLRSRGIRYVATRHEAGAVSMAAGYAGASGTIGLSIVSRGAGLTNSLTALVSAAKAKTPLLLFTGDSTATERERGFEMDPKFVDQASMLAAAGVRVVSARTAATAVHELKAAFERARLGETIAFMVPLDVLDSEAGVPADRQPTTASESQPAEIPGSGDITAAADLLEAAGTSARVIILAGRGAVHSGALAELEGLGQKTGSLMATTVMAKSLFAASPYDLGISGVFSGENARQLFADAEVVLAFGASLNEFTTHRGTLFPRAQVIQFDSDASALGRFYRPVIAVHADARQGALALADELDKRGYGNSGLRRAEVANLMARDQDEILKRNEGKAGAVDPHRLVALLDRVLPPDRAVVVDAGHQLTFACTHLTVPDPTAFFFPIEFQAIGIGLGVAMGVALARSDRLTVCTVGDGSFMMTLGELDTAVRYRLPLLILVINDSGFGAERHYLNLLGLSDDVANFVNPSFESLARHLGAEGLTINVLDDVYQLVPRLASLQGPLLVDCKVDPSVRADWIEFNLRREEPIRKAGTIS
jgi:thiamine pyrophosphate-dependent acetolactate synthase large subunit-like protein